MSATLPNAEMLGEWLDAVVYQGDFRPVPDDSLTLTLTLIPNPDPNPKPNLHPYPNQVPLKKYVVDKQGRAFTPLRELAFELRRPEPAAATGTAAATTTAAAGTATTGTATTATTAITAAAQRKQPAPPAPAGPPPPLPPPVDEWLVTLVRQAAGRGQGVIVFCGTKKDCEITALKLVRAAVCAGGMGTGDGGGGVGGGGGGTVGTAGDGGDGSGDGSSGGGGALYELEAACPDGATKGLEPQPWP